MKLLTRIMAAVPLLLATAAAFFYFSGFVGIPGQARVTTGNGTDVLGRFDGACSDGDTMFPLMTDGQKAGLDPAAISLLSWNSHKGSHGAFGADLKKLEQGIDLILLQEAEIGEKLKKGLQLSGRQWNMAVAFELEDKEVGLLSASVVAPVSACADRVSEPLLVLPKTILATTYPLNGMSEELLVVNVHMVNFTVTNEALRRQLAKLERVVKKHQGPVIVAGDFNTWSESRKTEVGRKMAQLGLQQVRFDPDNRSRFLSNAVDEIYFKGLAPLASFSHTVQTSDHNPIEVHFKVVRESISSLASHDSTSS